MVTAVATFPLRHNPSVRQQPGHLRKPSRSQDQLRTTTLCLRPTAFFLGHTLSPLTRSGTLYLRRMCICLLVLSQIQLCQGIALILLPDLARTRTEVVRMLRHQMLAGRKRTGGISIVGMSTALLVRLSLATDEVLYIIKASLETRKESTRPTETVGALDWSH